MKIFKALLALILLAAVIYGLNSSLSVGNQTLPPLGKFMNPSSGFWANARLAGQEAIISKDLDLSAPVQVTYDDRLVPHIFASNDRDLYYTQGYVIAKHRLWQMDLTARSTAGRLSEVLGPRTLAVDRESRQLGLGFAAENAVKGWSSDNEINKNVRAYIDGINAFIAGLSPAEYPLEFKLLDYEPEEWTMLHSALVMKAMARTLAGRAGDARASNTRSFLGNEKFAELFPEYNPKQSPIIPAGTSWDYITKKEVENEPTAPSLTIGYNDYSPEDELKLLMGSNNWAVDRSKTADGSTILAGDPHLSLTLPSIWFEAQLHAPGQNVYGVTIAGIQGVVIGFNDDIAWSETNVGHDIIDWFEIKWADKEKTKYIFNGSEQSIVQRKEVYQVKGSAAIVDTIKYAVWGPIWEASAASASNVDLAMRWLAHDQQPASEVATFEYLNKAKNFEEYRKAISHYVSPAQNFIFASQSGDIGLTVTGKLPIRGDQQGRFVQAGDDFKNDWPDMIPFEHNPYILNPERGFVSSANQHSTDQDYPYYYSGGGYFENYRGRRINDRLAEMNNITVDDMKALHYDSYSIKAAEALPIMLSSLQSRSDYTNNKLLQQVKEWNYKYQANSNAPGIFDTWFRNLYFLIWDEFDQPRLPVDRPESWKTIEIMNEGLDNVWYDRMGTEKIENLNDLIQSAFDSTQASFNQRIKNNQPIDWNSYRDTKILHLGRINAFSKINVVSDGSRGTLNALTSRTGPSWRMIVKFKDGVEAFGVYPGGQSGDPSSPYYDNMVEDWSKGKYYPIHFLTNASETKDDFISTNQLN